MKRNSPHTSTSLRPVYDMQRGSQSRRRPLNDESSGRPRITFAGSLIICLLLSLTVHLGWIKHVQAEETDARQAQLKQAALIHHHNDNFSVALQNISAQYPDTRVGVGVASNAMGTQIFGDDGSYDAASTAKLLTAAAYLHLVDEHKLNLQENLDGQNVVNLLHEMIINSDDTAWTELNSHIGHDYLESYARSLNLQQYNASSNSLTPRDMTILLQKLADGELLSPDRKILLLSLMQKANYRGYIVAAVPKEMTTYHKVGFTGGDLHDVAIITRGDRWMVLSIYTEGAADLASPERTALMQSITKVALNTYL